ncbi:hypothetical protein FRC10_002336 [Ceratobasidium sp. 414]|nr:hypothetical protein FRC10_002336 [Ceratobasidium sp. 414]
MPRRRPAPAQDAQSHHLARRFLQLDTDIRLAAAAGGLFPLFQDDRPDSPVRQYPWDAEIQHPRPRPAHGPIRIRQLENPVTDVEQVAKTKPKPIRSVSDPGDAHRLIARFIRSNEEKTRSMTIAVSDPSPASSAPSSSVNSTRESAGRAFPFPSMTHHSRLENFLELESSANETGREDPLALKLGQILARRAAAATRTISRRSRGSAGSRNSSRAGYGGATLVELDRLAESDRLEGKGKEVEREEGTRVARPRPPPLDLAGSSGGGRHAKRESVVIDDRSPHEGQSFLTRVAGSSTSIAPGPNPPAPDPTTIGHIGPRNEPERERTVSFAASRASLRSFVFPVPIPPPEPELEMHVQVQMQTPIRAQFQVVQSPVHAQFQVQQSPVRAQFQGQSPTQMRMPIRVQTEVRPASLMVQASPSSAYESPLESASWAMSVGGASPTVYRASPTMGYRAGASPMGYRASPIQRTSDAHVNLLRGLTPLPSHGLPLPAPNRPHSFNILDRSGLNLPRRFSMHLPPETTTARAPSPPLVHTPPPVASPTSAVIATPRKTPSPPVATSSPPRRFVPTPPRGSAERIPPAQVASPSPPTQFASPSPLPTQAPTPSPLPIRHVFPTASPDRVPTRALSPLPPRLRHHTNASHPSDGSGSDEVVFRGSSSSASSSPAKRRRSRARRSHTRVNSDGFVRRTMSEGVRPDAGGPRLGPRLSEVRRTGQVQMRRSQTGNGDGGEVSSDGREVVLFIPRGPPPPVPKVPTPPVVEAPILHAVDPALPVVKAPTPPAVVVDPPVVRAVPVPPPLVRKESIPLPQASPYPGAVQLGPPGVLVQSEEPVSNIVDEPRGGSAGSAPVPVRMPSFEPLQGSTVEPRRTHTLPWSPPIRVLSREGSFHTAQDSFAEDVDTDAEFPSGVSVLLQGVPYMDDERAGYVSTPAHEDESPMLSAEDDTIPRQDVPERATITSAMRGHVAQPAIVTRQSSREFVRVPGSIPSPPRSGTPARRAGGRAEGMLTGRFQRGFLVAPTPPVPSPIPSPPSSGSSRTHAHAASIPMRHDDHSPPRPEQLPRSVSPRTEVSTQPDEDSFQSVHTADNVLRLPLDDWLEFAMSSMAAMGIPLTRSTLEDLHESEDERVAVVTEVLSTPSMRGFEVDENNGGLLDGVSQADDDSDGDSPSLSLSPVSGTPSPARSGLFSTTGYGGMTTFSTAPPESTGTRPTIRTTDLGYSTDNPTNLSAISGVSASTEESESERAVGGLQDLAAAVRELNQRTPIPSGGSSRAPHSASTSLPMHTPFSGPGSHVGPPSFVGPPPIPGAYYDASPARALSPGAMSITFQESTPTLSSVPPLVVLPGDRDRFADSLLIAEYQHHQPGRSLHNLRDDDYRALDEGEDVVLYGIGGEWERVDARRIRTESHGTAGSGIPIEPADYGLEGPDAQSPSKYTQFVLSLANALRPPNVNRPQRWVEVALRTLRPHASGTQPSDLYDAISRAEAGLDDVPVPRVVPSHLGSTFISSTTSSTPKSSSIGSALPEDDEIVEEFIRSVLTPAQTPPPQPATPIRTDTPDVDPSAIPWPVLTSPVVPRFLLPPSSSSSPRSGYSSLIPPMPRPRSRSIEPHWLAIYMARRWATAQNHIARRTYSSPSALGPPMPYHWRPICHISPERLWEITNLAVRVDMPPPAPPPALSAIESVSPVEIARPHYTTPATTYGRATPHSARTGSSHRSRRTTTPAPPPAPTLAPVYPESTGMMTSHPNLPINPSHHSVALQTTISRTSIPLVQRPLGPQYVPRSSTSSDRPIQTAVVSGAVTPARVQRKRTMRELVGRLVGKGRTRVRSISHSRSPSPLVSRSRFGFAGKVVDVARRAMRYPRRRARVSSIRSQRAQAVRDA